MMKKNIDELIGQYIHSGLAQQDLEEIKGVSLKNYDILNYDELENMVSGYANKKKLFSHLDKKMQQEGVQPPAEFYDIHRQIAKKDKQLEKEFEQLVGEYATQLQRKKHTHKNFFNRFFQLGHHAHVLDISSPQYRSLRKELVSKAYDQFRHKPFGERVKKFCTRQLHRAVIVSSLMIGSTILSHSSGYDKGVDIGAKAQKEYMLTKYHQKEFVLKTPDTTYTIVNYNKLKNEIK